MRKVTVEEVTQVNQLARGAIAAAIEVQSVGGVGLLESAYERALCHELALRNIPVRRQVPIPFRYKGTKLGTAFRADLILDELLLVELKVAKCFISLDDRQVRTYLSLSGCALGLLLNFGKILGSGGIRRIINPETWPDERPRT